jgi:flagellar basal-body rod protein FlgC
MISAMNIPLSGMLAASTALNVSASNIANMQSDGPVPQTGPLQPVTQTPGSVYQPITVSDTPVPGGGVTTTITPVLPAYTLAYDPTAPFANLQGMVAAPNVNLAQEVVNQLSASVAYKANIFSLKVAQDMVNTLLETA